MRSITEDVPVRDERERESFTTSYGDADQQVCYDGLSCADFSSVPGRAIADVEAIGLLTDDE